MIVVVRCFTTCLATLTAVALLTFPLLGSVARSSPQPSAFLRDHLRLTDAEMSSVERGVPVAKTLPVSEKREFAIAGAVRIRGSKEVFVGQYADVVRFRKSATVPQVGVFRVPPQPDDVAALKLPDPDLDDLRRCAVGDCKVQLPAAFVQRVQRVPWGTPNAPEQATAIMRDLLVERTRAYLGGGDAVLEAYNHRETPISLAAELKGIVAASDDLLRDTSVLKTHVLEFPQRAASDVRDVVYWSEERFGVKPVISVTHLAAHAPPGATAAFVAEKQIYASHYFDGSLVLAAALDDPRSDGDPAFYLAFVSRARVTRLGGLFGGMLRSRLQKRAQGGMGKALLVMKQRIENRS